MYKCYLYIYSINFKITMKIGFIICLVSAIVCGGFGLLLLFFSGKQQNSFDNPDTLINMSFLVASLTIIYIIMAVFYRQRNIKVLYLNIIYFMLIGLFYSILPADFGFNLGWHIGIASILIFLTLKNYKKLELNNHEENQTVQSN